MNKMYNIQNTPLSLDVGENEITCFIHGGHLLLQFKKIDLGWVEISTIYDTTIMTLRQIFDEIEDFINETSDEEDYIIAKESIQNIINELSVENV